MCSYLRCHMNLSPLQLKKEFSKYQQIKRLISLKTDVRWTHDCCNRTKWLTASSKDDDRYSYFKIIDNTKQACLWLSSKVAGSCIAEISRLNSRRSLLKRSDPNPVARTVQHPLRRKRPKPQPCFICDENRKLLQAWERWVPQCGRYHDGIFIRTRQHFSFLQDL